MFKVEKPDYVNKTFRINRKLLETLEAIAQNENISVNALVVQCCEYAINNMSSASNEGNSKSDK